MPETARPRRRRVRGETWRFIPSHFPPVGIFENLLDPDELEAAYRLEGLTNERLRDQAGDIALVPPQDRLVGPGTTPIMAAFTHIGYPSRFTDGGYGIYYAGLDRDTALEEARHSRARFLGATGEGAQELTLRCIQCRIDAALVDLRRDAACHDPNDYTRPQALGASLRRQGDMGILYKSVRHPPGQCVAVLRPPALSPPANQAGHYRFVWDGGEITHVFEMHQLR